MKASRLVICQFFTGLLIASAMATCYGQPEDDVQISPGLEFRGTYSCERCHAAPTERDKEQGITDRVQLTEWTTWNNNDKHAAAYKVLTEERGQRMADLMHKDVLDEATGCIQCHTSNAEDAYWSKSCFDGDQNRCISEGVGCESCHGPSSEWFELHFLPGWRDESDAQKTALGWTQVRKPVPRAELCLSCHLGSPKDNRIITHEMYAAGHPPLSGFELETFANKMPRHWRFAYEKPGEPQVEFQRTKYLLVASVVALRLSVETAAADAVQLTDAERWPELARLECYSCHHNLKLPSWRQERASLGKVGRPRLALGCIPLIRVAAHQAADGRDRVVQFDKLLGRLQEPFAVNPLGDPRQIKEIAPQVVEWCVDVEARLAAMTIQPQQAVDILMQIQNSASGELIDYDTARQLIGALDIVQGELAAADSSIEPFLGPPPEQQQRFREWFNLLDDKQDRVEKSYPQSLKNRSEFPSADFSRRVKSVE